MEFGLLMADIPVYVSCKFEMYIYKTVLVLSENVYIAFLYVLSILTKTLQTFSWLFGSHDNPLTRQRILMVNK